MPPVEPSGLPLAALERFGGVAGAQVLGLLRLLAPLTTSAAQARGSAA
jgi:hypothetical protein